MNFKKLMVSGFAIGALTLSSINLSYADTEAAENQIENNSIEYMTLNEKDASSIVAGILISENTDLIVNSNIKEFVGKLVDSLSTKVEPTKAKVELAKAKVEPTEAKVEPTEAKVEPTEAKVEPTEAKVEPTEAKVEPTEAKVEPTEAKVEPTEAKVEPTEAKVEPTEAKVEAKTLTKWTTAPLNVRQASKVESKSLGVLAKGTKVTGTLENNWLKIEYNGKTGYVSSSYLSNTEVAKDKPKEEVKETTNNNGGNDKEFAYSKVLTVKATAYSMNEPGLSHKTASGIDLRQNPNVIAVDRSVIPLGTKVYVEGYGYAIAGDTGGAIKGNKIDVHFNSVDRCYQWGVKNNVKVYILK